MRIETDTLLVSASYQIAIEIDEIFPQTLLLQAKLFQFPQLLFICFVY